MDTRTKQILIDKYNEDPSKMGEIRPLAEGELENSPWMVPVSAEEQELLEQLPQRERVEAYHDHQCLKTLQSFADFLREQIKEGRKLDELINRTSR